MIRIKKEERIKFYQSCFLGEGGIEFVCKQPDASLKKHFREAKKYCYIPVKNIDDLRNQIKERNFLSIKRVSEWEKSSIPILNFDGNIHNFDFCRADYNIINKWGHKRFYKCFYIIYSDDFSVIWFGERIDKPVFWVSMGKTVYMLTYLHKRLLLYPNACFETELVSGLDIRLLDNIVKIYEKRFCNDYPTNDIKKIELGKCFKKGFFYKGPKYDFKNSRPYYDYISEIKNVDVQDGLIRIQIENITYPNSGYAYLDLEKLEVTHTEIKE